MIDKNQYTFNGDLVAFLGDTPAVNLVGGFKEGVAMALRKCRHCMATDSQIQTKVSVKNMIIITLELHLPLFSLLKKILNYEPKQGMQNNVNT